MNFVFILGPTGVGKSSFALNEALKRKAEIINCDSVQVFKGLRVGSAQPKKEELQKVPHHLYGFVDTRKTFTVGDYLREVKKVLEKIQSKTIFFVGGSGFFITALEKGLWPAPKTSDLQKKKMEKKALKKGLPTLYKELQEKDPLYSKKIHHKDSYRIQRALLIMESEKKNLTEIQNDFKQKNFSFLNGPILKIGLKPLEKEVYKLKLQKRIQDMIEIGLKEETQELLKHESNFPTQALKSVGYKQMAEVLKGKLLEKDLEEAILQHTLKLAKKQNTWFKKDKTIHWFSSEKKAYLFLAEKLPFNF